MFPEPTQENIFDPDSQGERYYWNISEAARDPNMKHPYLWWNDRLYALTASGYIISFEITRDDL